MADTSITGYYGYLAVTTTTYYDLGYCVQPAVPDEVSTLDQYGSLDNDSTPSIHRTAKRTIA
eukprot:3751864-Rhodomonas_salina.1